ncbi:MAG: SprT family zinc-dependent metalloprotease [Dehalococcoidia bacterium]
MQAEDATLEIGPGTIAYRLRRSRRRRRTLEVSVDATGLLSVAVPMRTTRAEIDAFLHGKRAWIRKQLEEHRNGARRLPERSFATGESLPYLGRHLLVDVVDASDAPRTAVRLAGERLELRVPAGLFGDERRSHISDALERWYMSRARATLLERVRYFAPQVGAQPKRVVVKSQKTRWGSCGNDGTLRFNWCLVMAPLPVIDYIAVHELCHLRRPGHSKAFWQLVATVLPDYQLRKAELRREGWSYRLQ